MQPPTSASTSPTCSAAPTTSSCKVRGQSMIEDHIDDGDFVVIRKQETAENGERVVAMIDNEVTLKRFHVHQRQGDAAARATAPCRPSSSIRSRTPTSSASSSACCASAGEPGAALQAARRQPGAGRPRAICPTRARLSASLHRRAHRRIDVQRRVLRPVQQLRPSPATSHRRPVADDVHAGQPARRPARKASRMA